MPFSLRRSGLYLVKCTMQYLLNPWQTAAIRITSHSELYGECMFSSTSTIAIPQTVLIKKSTLAKRLGSSWRLDTVLAVVLYIKICQ